VKAHRYSIATKLFINIMLIHTALISMVVYDIIHKESEFIHSQLLHQGQNTSTILASNASVALLNNDIVALDELLMDMKNISQSYMIFILDKNLRVRASIPSHYFNQRLVDTISLSLFDSLKSSNKKFQQIVHDEYVDTVAAIYADGEIIGYVRILLDERNFNLAITDMLKESLMFALLAILLGSIVAWLSVNRMTLSLKQLTLAAQKIAQREFDVALPKITKSDEIAAMVRAFAVMQDSINNYLNELHRNQERLTLALEGSNDGLWDADLISYDIYFSPRWKEMLGYKNDEFENSYESWERALHPDDKIKVTAYLNDFLSSSATHYEIKFRMQKKDGSYLPILSRAKKIYNANGKAIRLIGTHVDISEITHANEQLQYKALHDLLTDLPNRQYLQKELHDTIALSSKEKSAFAMIFLDLDHFKKINDTHGHTVGDALLVEIAKILKQSVLHEDFVARLGGDEFIIILKNIHGKKEIIERIERIMSHVSQPHFIHYRTFYTTFSMGITLYPQDGLDGDMLLKNADIAMYHAKHISRNTYQFYTHDLGQKVIERSHIEFKLRNAIDNKEIVLYYQPQIDTRTETIVGVEVLARWIPQKGEPISPSLFIPLAEDIGLIFKLDAYIMNEALATFGQWRAKGAKIAKISLNLSLAELNVNDYVDYVTQMLEHHQIKPSFLELEITESQIMKDPINAINALTQLAQLGIAIAIDDFGTGYSSLSYLKQLPVHKLKIDKSFIDDILSNNDSQVIVKTIISMAKNMNLEIIAEGVESLEQKLFLAQNGCHEVQGYYYYQPLSLEEFEKLILVSLDM